MRGRLQIEIARFGVVLGVRGFRRASQPIVRARLLQRSLGDLRKPREMALGFDRLVQEPQSDPAGVEFGVDLVAGLGGGMIRAKRVSGLRISLVEKLARDDAPLLPPGVAVDDLLDVARRIAQQRAGFSEFFVVTQLVHTSVKQSGIVLHRRRQRSRQLIDAGDARAGEQRDVLAGELGAAQRERILSGVEQTIGAELVIGRRQKLAELLIEDRIEPLSDILVAPGVARQRRRRFEISLASDRPRQGIFAKAGERLVFRKPGQHGLVGVTLGDERLLAATAQPVAGGPIRVSRKEFGDAPESGFVGMKPKAGPSRGGLGKRRMEPRRGVVALREISGPVCGDRLGENLGVVSQQGGGGIRTIASTLSRFCAGA